MNNKKNVESRNNYGFLFFIFVRNLKALLVVLIKFGIISIYINFMKFIIFLIIFNSGIVPVFGQRTLSGRIIGEDLEIPLEIYIYDNDSMLLGKTDFDGYFKISFPEKATKLFFRGINYEKTEIVVFEDCDYLEIILLNYHIYDFISSNKIDRLRKKRFNKLSEIRQKAIKEKLFNFKKICYNQEFKPIKSELDKH